MQLIDEDRTTLQYFERIADDPNYDPRSAINALINSTEKIVESAWQDVNLEFWQALGFLDAYRRESANVLDFTEHLSKVVKELEEKVKGIQSTSNADVAGATIEGKLEEADEEAGKLLARYQRLMELEPLLRGIAGSLSDFHGLIKRNKAKAKWFRRFLHLVKSAAWLLGLGVATLLEFGISSFLDSAFEVTVPIHWRISAILVIYFLETSFADPRIEFWERGVYSSHYRRILQELRDAICELYSIRDELSKHLTEA
jgi:hypothetical protein